MSRVLTVNAGSSSLKLALLDEFDSPIFERTIASSGSGTDQVALLEVLGDAGPIDAVGHRIVHGGLEFTGPVIVDDAVVNRLESLRHMAPLHQSRSLQALDLVSKSLPELTTVACFDTAFHADLPPMASTFALPREWRQRWGLRRFGFHGLSHAYASRRAAELVARPLDELRLISCHLGAGASLAAVQGGRSVDTTMGFTPLDGLVMATRSGSVDPGLLLWLATEGGLALEELATQLEHGSGLFGLAETPDMRVVLQRAHSGDQRASLALEVYLHSLRAGIASMAAAMGGADALVFTGGVGENSPEVRSRSMESLGFLGFSVDAERNRSGSADRRISPEGSPADCMVVTAHEDREIAREVRSLLAI